MTVDTLPSACRHTTKRQGANSAMWNDMSFPNLSLAEWVGVAVMAPFLFAFLTLIGYLIVGAVGSNARRRRIAIERQQAEQAEQALPTDESASVAVGRQAPDSVLQPSNVGNTADDTASTARQM